MSSFVNPAILSIHAQLGSVCFLSETSRLRLFILSLPSYYCMSIELSCNCNARIFVSLFFCRRYCSILTCHDVDRLATPYSITHAVHAAAKAEGERPSFTCRQKSLASAAQLGTDCYHHRHCSIAPIDLILTNTCAAKITKPFPLVLAFRRAERIASHARRCWSLDRPGR